MKKAFLFLLFLPILLSAVRVDVSVNKYTISTNDQLTLTLKISDSARLNVSEPSAPVVNLLSFRNMTSSSASSVSWQGGGMVSEHSHTYNYIYFPQKTGKTTIPAFSVKVNNRDYKTRPIDITVIAAANPNSKQSQSSPAFPNSNPYGFTLPDYWGDNNQALGNTFLTALPETQYVYSGFPALVSYYLYTDEMVRSFNLEEENDFEGYGKSTYEQPTMLNYEDVRHNGKNYKRALIKRLAIMPNREGTLQAPQMKGIARLYNFGYLNKSLQSTGGVIAVRPLPRTNVAAGFNGAVGNFKLSHSISKAELALGEALTFILKIQGRGNFNRFSAPAFATGKGFQVSSPVVMDNINAGIEGSRTFYYTLIPQSKGQLKLPDLPFSWFDNDQGEYRTYSISNQIIEVKSANVLSYLNRIWEPQTPRSMHPKINKAKYPAYITYAGQAWYWLIVFLILAFCVLVSIKAYELKLKRKSPELYAKKQAGRILQKYMKQATNAAQNLSPEFYPLAEKALFDYLTAKYKLGNSLSTEEKISMLREQNVPLELVEEMQSFLQHCLTARFMPEADRTINLQEDLGLLQNIIFGFSRLKNHNQGV
ncbi:MAG: BatD family protein [Candidatus Cloacimonetes bacterium]|nr:BatD family protein [Candidatus Cloacimonadota bacterium]